MADGRRHSTIENPADCGRMIEEALATPDPVVVRGVVDPFEPPLPAKVTLDQAAKFAKSLLRGEPTAKKSRSPRSAIGSASWCERHS
jgi:pyruvate dehydrogenase (quinone)/pyruvate oxidase